MDFFGNKKYTFLHSALVMIEPSIYVKKVLLKFHEITPFCMPGHKYTHKIGGWLINIESSNININNIMQVIQNKHRCSPVLVQSSSLLVSFCLGAEGALF